MKINTLRWLIPVSIAALSGCGMFSDSNTPKASAATTTNVSVAQCSQVNDPQADSLLLAANNLAQTSLSQMASSANTGSWSDVKNSAPTAALITYNQILAKYPNHCGAQFGKAIAILANLTTNQDINNSINQLDSNSNSTITSGISYATYLNTSTDKVPSALFRVSLATAKSNPETISNMQTVVANNVLPVTDTAIALLTSVLAYNNFFFEVVADANTANPDTIIINKGQVGPALAAIKMIKALLVTFVSVQSEIAVNGRYDWLDTIGAIQNSDFDHLRAGQTAALDQLVSLTDKGSPFLTIKSDWQSSYSTIPSLIKSAITDVQTSLSYSIGLADSSLDMQRHAPYIVGNGKSADVSPSELQTISDNLSRLNKYLDGPVSIEYNTHQTTTGKVVSDTLVVDFPKYYQVFTGFQDFLPYHKVLPYTEWNDTIAADTVWYDYLDLYSPTDGGMGTIFANQISSTLYKNLATVTSYSEAYNYNTGNFVPMVIMSNGDSLNYSISGCLAQLYKSNAIVVDTFTMNGCKAGASSLSYGTTAEYISYIDATIRGPYEFTDANGNPSFGVNQYAEIQNIYDTLGITGLANKIVFPDPTFGGVFPQLTNTSIWTTLSNLENIHPRHACSDNGVYNSSWGECTAGHTVLPTNPSDLDVLTYYFQ